MVSICPFISSINALISFSGTSSALDETVEKVGQSGRTVTKFLRHFWEIRITFPRKRNSALRE